MTALLCHARTRAGHCSALGTWYQDFTKATPVLVSHFPEGYKELPPTVAVQDTNGIGDDPIVSSIDLKSGSERDQFGFTKEDYNF